MVGGGGARSEESATWSGDELILWRASYGGPSGEFFEHRETWSVDAERLLHITVTERSSGAPPTKQSQVFRKR
jgi:hypothetical protein